MSDAINERALALAGLLQALMQVRRIADTGQSDHTLVQLALDSVLRIDAASTESVYAGVNNLRPGLRLLRDYLGNEKKDDALGKLALAVLQIERRFVRDEKMTAQVQSRLQQLSTHVDAQDSTHPDVIAELATLYAETISHLRPRVMVQGNPHYLAQPGVVAEIRALLLAALRSAVLWRQLGGSFWDLLLQRRALAKAVDQHLH
jgi:high frequency lysogenization protein